jgi:hypothetical protein
MMRALALAWLVCAGVAQAADMTVLRYVDQDPGDPAYTTRLLVTADYLRMDTGDDAGDFVLLDRRHKRVRNVMRDSRLVMVFAPGTVPAPSADWTVRFDVEPAAAGTERYRLSVKGHMCSEGIVAPRAAPDAARALAELKAVLAATQYRVWKDSPPTLRHDCDLANLVWDFGALLGRGLPLEEHEFNGRTRHFETESREPVRPELFTIPPDFAMLDAPSS